MLTTSPPFATAVCDDYIAGCYNADEARDILRQRPTDGVILRWLNWDRRHNPSRYETADGVHNAIAYFYQRMEVFVERPAPTDAELREVLGWIVRHSANIAGIRNRILRDARFRDRHPIVSHVGEESLGFAFWKGPVTRGGHKVWVRAHRADTGELVAGPM